LPNDTQPVDGRSDLGPVFRTARISRARSAAARYINDNLADYLIPVNADVPSIDIIMVPERDDRVNPLGIKGVGELGFVGMNAAVANAVFNATGKRVRALPIRSEKLL
jgi:xanthine dehydrogenase YagR molybdenum-binding subunit